jgi:hypothetical protein
VMRKNLPERTSPVPSVDPVPTERGARQAGRTFARNPGDPAHATESA